MKKLALLLLALLLCCGAALAEMPEEAGCYAAENYPGYEPEDYLTVEGTSMGDHGLMLIRHEGQRRLLCFRQLKGQWVCWLDSAEAVPQSDLPARLSRYPAGERFSRLWDDEDKYQYLSNGQNFYVYIADEEKNLQKVEYHWQNDGFHLLGYQWAAGQYADILGDEVVFYDIGNGLSGRYKWEKETSLSEIVFDALPTNEMEALGFTSDARKIPYSTLEVMHDYTDAFEPDMRFPVYMGPGKSYGRSGNGKAVVSTNDWIEVYGSWGDWLFIRYAIDEEKERFGWIAADALLEKVPAAPLREFMWFQVDEDCTLTDDPLGSGAALCKVPAGAEVERLAYLNSDWCYIRYESKGQTWWGFIPSRLITRHLGNG